MQALSERLQQQEVKSRRLEATLAQHHYHMERLIQQHHDEVASLQSALQAAQIRLQHQIQAFEEQVRNRLITFVLNFFSCVLSCHCVMVSTNWITPRY
jgi:hypothetical protein